MARKLGILGLLRDVLCPPTCRICKTLMEVEPPWGLPPRPLCKKCMPTWENETYETCGICSLRVTECICMPEPMEKAGAKGFCKCLYYDPHKSRPVQNRLIYRIKKRADHAVTGFFAEELAKSVGAILQRDGVVLSDVMITYVPRSREGCAENGTDQAAELARALSRQLHLPMVRMLARKRGTHTSQKKLTPPERLKNARASYCTVGRRRCEQKVIILVDDIVTTGASMSACTGLLHQMGASAVYCAAVATDLVNRDK